MEKIGNTMNQVIKQLSAKNPRLQALLEDAKKNLEKKDTSGTWKTLTPITDDCPYQKCDGTGLIHMHNTGSFQDKLVICKCKEEKQREREIREISKIPPSFQDSKIDTFDINLYEAEENRELAFSTKLAAKNFVKHFDKFREVGKGLYIFSKTKGSGKTRLACSVGNALMNVHKVKVHFTTTTDLLDNIRKTFGQDSQYTSDEIIEMYRSVDVLIMDDIGLENVTAWVVEKFTQILNDRMEQKKVTIFTSNLIVGELDFRKKNDFKKENENDDGTERIISRINKMSIEIALPEENVRDILAEEENEDLSKLLY